MYDENRIDHHLASSVAPVRRERPLDRIEHAANLTMDLSMRVDAFLARFHGHPSPPQAARGDRDIPVVSYASQIDRLFGNLNTLSECVATLEEIG